MDRLVHIEGDPGGRQRVVCLVVRIADLHLEAPRLGLDLPAFLLHVINLGRTVLGPLDEVWSGDGHLAESLVAQDIELHDLDLHVLLQHRVSEAEREDLGEVDELGGLLLGQRRLHWGVVLAGNADVEVAAALEGQVAAHQVAELCRPRRDAGVGGQGLDQVGVLVPRPLRAAAGQPPGPVVAGGAAARAEGQPAQGRTSDVDLVVAAKEDQDVLPVLHEHGEDHGDDGDGHELLEHLHRHAQRLDVQVAQQRRAAAAVLPARRRRGRGRRCCHPARQTTHHCSLGRRQLGRRSPPPGLRSGPPICRYHDPAAHGRGQRRGGRQHHRRRRRRCRRRRCRCGRRRRRCRCGRHRRRGRGSLWQRLRLRRRGRKPGTDEVRKGGVHHPLHSLIGGGGLRHSGILPHGCHRRHSRREQFG
mmetsp:Transcript_23083/g.60991  ORF Transcript_23083/g.60991 Transcript_23083/m.60991 type:complete len:417 (-) Transcript_23083:237-1487(-)